MGSGVCRIAAVTGAALVVSLATGIAPAHAAERIVTVDTAAPVTAGPFCTSAAGDCPFDKAIAEANDSAEGSDPVTKIVFDSALGDHLTLPPGVPGVEITASGLIVDGGGITLRPGLGFHPNEDGDVIGIYADGVTIQELGVQGFGDYTGIEVRAEKSGNTITRSAIADNARNIELATDGDPPGNHGLDAPGQPRSTESGVKVRAPDPFAMTSEITKDDTYTLELFACAHDNEGKQYLSTQSGVARGQTVYFNVGTIAGDDQFSATATDEQTGDTSEFSTCSVKPADDEHATGYPAPLDSANCEPGSICTAAPPEGSEERFTVNASGGNIPAELVAELNGGAAPECGLPADSDLALSPDWVRFGFDPPTAGQSWTKDVTITSLEAMSAEEAEAAKDETQVCYTAPYQFDTRGGYPALAGGPDGLEDFYGILPDCTAVQPGDAAENSYGPFGPYGPYEGAGPYGPFGPFGPPGAGGPSTPATPGTPGPCVSGRQITQNGGDFFTQITFRVPAGELDPQGRSARKRR